GRVIGKRGVTAQSLRTLLRALGTKNDARYNLKIVNNDGQTGATMSSDDSHQNTGETARDSGNEGDSDDAYVSTVSEPVETTTDEPVDNTSDYTKKTRQELAELDDLDI